MAKIHFKPSEPLPPEWQDALEERFLNLLRDDPIVHSWFSGSQSGGLLGLVVVLGEHRKIDLARITGAMAMRCPNPEAHGRQ